MPLGLGDTGDAESLAGKARMYLDSLRVRRFADSTIVNTARHLASFFQWCEERGITRPEDVTRAAIESYQRYLALTYRGLGDKRLTIQYQYARLVAIMQCFRWLTRRGYLAVNPAADIELPKLPKTLPRTGFTIAEVEHILAQPNVTEPFGLRDRAIMETLYSTGIRRAELSALRTTSIVADAHTVTIREGKGRKDRIVPIGDRAIRWIDRYVRDARPRLVMPPDDGFLFLSNAGTPFSLSRLGNIVRAYIDASGIDSSRVGSCHLFRHSMATQMLERGADVRVIQEILGHERLETTAIYTRVSIQHLVAVHGLTHPASPTALPAPTRTSAEAKLLLRTLAREAELETDE